MSRQPTNWRTIIPKKFSHCYKSFRAHNRFPNLWIWQRDWEPPGNLTMKARGIWLQNFHRTGKTECWRAQENLCTPGPRKRSSDPTRDWPRLACKCPGVSGGGVGWQWPAVGSGARPQQSLELWHAGISPYEGGHHYCHYPYFGLRPNYREGTQPHPSAENWVKDLLSTTLPTRARPSFPHSQSLSSGSFHMPLIFIHQRADRMKTSITEN